MKRRVVHLTTTHARDEVRVFLKECTSLSAAGYDVYLIVADGLGLDTTSSGVRRLDIGKQSGRIQRMLIQPWRMLRAAFKIRADVYHLHEPELLLIALPLKWSGAKVVYDSHEDTPRAILSRDWINPFLRKLVSSTFELFENFVTSRISAVVGATPHISLRFSNINKRAVTVNNYPLQSELPDFVMPLRINRSLCYIGSISKSRGVFEMINAVDPLDAQLILVGWFESEQVELNAKKLNGWSKIDYRGTVNRSEVHEIMSRSSIGLVIFHPEPNHVNAQPNKLFEYMSARLPIIASDFPLWREVIEGNDCGLCVDPMNPSAISEAINLLLTNPERVKKFGDNGYRAVQEKYNWGIEEQKLLTLYNELTK